MKTLIAYLFLTCFTAAVIAAQTDGNEANVPQMPPDPQNLTIKPADSNAHAAYKQRLERMERRRRESIAQTQTEQRSAAEQEKQTSLTQAVESQIAEEYKKHTRRIAILDRIRQLAKEDSLTDKIQKVDSLLKMENERHRKKLVRLQQRPVGRPSPKSEPNQKQQPR